MMRREEPIPALSAGLSYVVMTGLLLAIALPPHGNPPDTESKRAEAKHAESQHDEPHREKLKRDAARAPETPLSAAPSATPKAPPNADAPEKVATVPTAAARPSETDPPPVVEEWTPEEIVSAKEQCNKMLASVSAEVEWLPPIKKGACGLPQPVSLKRVNDVTFNPPVQVNCRMVAALGSWVKSTLQPNAEKRLKSRVVGIVGSYGYSCRNIYHRQNARLSQHALANAIDISGFKLADGRTVRVLKGWGLTARDIKARQAKAEAKAKAKAEADAKAKAKAKADSKSDESGKKSVAAAAPQDGKTKVTDAPRSGKLGGPYAKNKDVTKASLTLTLPSKAGAKPDAPAGAEKAEPVAPPPREAAFLRAIHGGACGSFGTVLGPEANDPHRDHFHLDLIPRRGSGYCR